MTLSITIPDSIAPQVIDNICISTAYDAGSGKTKTQWAKEKVIDQIKALNAAGAMRAARDAEAAATTGIN